jgi:acetyltransferase-like isoleucine patch superfamily enzyme
MFLTKRQINKIGFKSIGDDVLISDKASIYNPSDIEIGSNIRIDDFCVISAGNGGIKIGSNIHIAIFSSLIGAGKITLSDFCNLSSRVSIYSSSDDYSGESLTNPTIPDKYKKVNQDDVFIGRHVIIGSGSVILPGIVLNEGVSIGALSLVTKTCEAFGIYAGAPAKRIKERSRKLLKLELEFLKSKSICQ